jgi:DNA-binding GntR family transcriptional regulator
VSDELSHVSASTLRDGVADALRQAIISGRWSPNSRLHEARIAQQLGVSRAPVREALSQLEEEGLVRSEPNRGTFVTELSIQDIEEIQSLREVLECFALRRAADKLMGPGLADLERMLADQVSAADAGDRLGLLEKDMELHRHICFTSGHNHLFKLWTRLANQTRRFMFVNFQVLEQTQGDLRLVVEGHVAIVQALRDRDVEAAEQALRQHLNDSLGTMLQA